ncbi:hypothetical protein SERLA73DRAFT_191115 [Serpula lacrymans var. lacrymans S7.3]|uniref:Uncharacterized protein n=2 Tax=Serpula lacrymans var. lacrymans TaxID=341189 RepID=F8QGX9_SERL3|nr:uncharacterized protein SERLADRAFT_480718 [Serpula lacrymans var. lacrymans S7.9]EGN92461.1 hypothetical protein SERLA73DRAFT_191115 [Serpula lacrymans var. lacrymans S7.3]EGO18589.1 hypothetical protein SERLADRAFT_480718 [Serpula lacrymans var. lacrymans S7.9]
MWSSCMRTSLPAVLRSSVASRSTFSPAAASRIHVRFLNGNSDAYPRNPGRSLRPPASLPGDERWNDLTSPLLSYLNKAEDRTPKLTPEEAWSQRVTENLPAPADAYTGRRVQVIDGDVGRAYDGLQRRLKRNSVAKELRLTARHEKKGAKRRRLRSERWRKQFANEVRKKVQLVSTIRRRGTSTT